MEENYYVSPLEKKKFKGQGGHDPAIGPAMTRTPRPLSFCCRAARGPGPPCRASVDRARLASPLPRATLLSCAVPRASAAVFALAESRFASGRRSRRSPSLSRWPSQLLSSAGFSAALAASTQQRLQVVSAASSHRPASRIRHGQVPSRPSPHKAAVSCRAGRAAPLQSRPPAKEGFASVGPMERRPPCGMKQGKS